MKLGTTALLCALSAGAALAHSGVKDKTVLARMEQMKVIGQQVGVLSNMARGKTAFDPDQAAQAHGALTRHAAEIPAMFRIQARDPKSEALPGIWSDWPEFIARSEALEAALARLDTGSRESIRRGLRPVAQACGGCHEAFRLEQ